VIIGIGFGFMFLRLYGVTLLVILLVFRPFSNFFCVNFLLVVVSWLSAPLQLIARKDFSMK